MSSKSSSPLSGAQRVVLAVGLPGAGKSTWFAKQGVRPLSSDEMRILLSDDEDNQQIHMEVFESLRFLLVKRLELGMPATYIDATSLTRIHRQPFIELAAKHGAQAEALWFDTPLEVCLERNAKRRRQVPEDVMRAMWEGFEEPSKAEGLARIERVSV